MGNLPTDAKVRQVALSPEVGEVIEGGRVDSMSKPGFAPGPVMAAGFSIIEADIPRRTICAMDYSSMSEPEWRTYQRLFAAAPDLYEALKRLTEYGNIFRYRKGETNPYEQAMEALAKAEGQQ